MPIPQPPPTTLANDAAPLAARSGLLANFVLGSIGVALVATLIAGVVYAPRPMPNFAMRVQGSKTMHLSDFHGKWLVVTFGCTDCPASRPAHLANLADVLAKLGAAANQVRVLFISVDPRRDTPAVLGAYLRRFNSSFVGAHIAMPELTMVASEFDLPLEPAIAAKGDAYKQLTEFEIVDPGGHLKGPVSSPLQVADLSKVLGLL